MDALVGQDDLRARLKIVMTGARLREAKPPHVLLSGAPGMGKTTLAKIIAHELHAPLIVATGPTLRRPVDLAGLLFSVDPEESPLTVLFVDEIHRLPIIVEEALYEVLEDGAFTMLTGNGSEARSLTLKVPSMIVIGATTKPGAMSQPLRDRFGFHAPVEPYDEEQIAVIVGREWARFAREVDDDAALVVARRAKGVPRIALHLAARVLDVCSIEGTSITGESAERALQAFGIGKDGLDETDWRILEALVVTFRGRAVGLESLAQALDIDPYTIERDHEGPLVRQGLMMRTPSGRMASPKAFESYREGRGF